MADLERVVVVLAAALPLAALFMLFAGIQRIPWRYGSVIGVGMIDRADRRRMGVEWRCRAAGHGQPRLWLAPSAAVSRSWAMNVARPAGTPKIRVILEAGEQPVPR